MPPSERSDKWIALVVDDSPDTLSMISTALEENGISALVATSGYAGVNLAKRIVPDVILLDAMMPEIDGFDTCQILKADEDLAYVPVMFMTGLSDPEHIIRGLQMGGVDYVKKPAVIDELIARITTHILNAKAIQSARQALDTSGRSVLALSAERTLLWGSPNAIGLLKTLQTCEANDPLTNANFAKWLTSCTQLPASQAQAYCTQTATFDYVGMSPAREILLKIKRKSNVSPATILATAFSLTPREAEVLYWLSMGKTNRDIADILALSSRTINKHLEQIFQKMGVDNRTSAAVAADRIIHNT